MIEKGLDLIKELKDDLGEYVIIFIGVMTGLFLVVQNTDISTKRAYVLLAIIGVAGAGLCVYIMLTRRFPKFRKDASYVLIAVHTHHDENDRKTLEKYFYSEIRERFNKVDAGDLKVRFLREYQTEKYYNADKEKQVGKFQKSGAFLIFAGDGKHAKHNGEDVFSIHLSLGVNDERLHPVLKKAIERELNQTASELDRIYVPDNNNAEGFSDLSAAVKYVADYIFGISLFFSQKLQEAEKVFFALNEDISRISKNIPTVAMLKHIVPLRLALTYGIISEDWYDRYRETGDKKCLDNMAEYLRKQEKLKILDEAYYTNMSILLFCRDRDVKKAKEYILECDKKQFKGYAWRFNRVFLSTYDSKSNERLANAYRNYRSILKNNPHWHTESQIEDFIVDLLEKEPEQKQMYWLLSMLTNARGDYKLSADYLSSFEAWDKFKPGKDMEKYISEINNCNMSQCCFIK